jgi:hypothetical protein
MRFPAVPAVRLTLQILVRPSVKLLQIPRAHAMITHATLRGGETSQLFPPDHWFPPSNIRMKFTVFPPGREYDIFVVLSRPAQQICRLAESRPLASGAAGT